MAFANGFDGARHPIDTAAASPRSAYRYHVTPLADCLPWRTVIRHTVAVHTNGAAQCRRAHERPLSVLKALVEVEQHSLSGFDASHALFFSQHVEDAVYAFATGSPHGENSTTTAHGVHGALPFAQLQ